MKTQFDKASVMSATNSIELLDIVRSGNYFSANGWSYETADKYLFSVDGKLVEAGFYTHYADDNMDRPIKQVIELPTSYGCPMKCAYCASSFIADVTPLTAEVLYDITDTLMGAHEIYDGGELLITLTGTGDACFTLGLISEYIPYISQKHDNLWFTVSSCNWTREMIKTVEKLSVNYRFRNIQSTFISANENLVGQIIPGLQYTDHKISELIEHITGSSFRNWRINYLMLKSVNDDDESFAKFTEIIQPIKDKVVVRISSLNETIASNNNGLKPSALQRSKILQNMLKANGINAYLFYSEHNDNMNCGQLVLESIITGAYQEYLTKR